MSWKMLLKKEMDSTYKVTQGLLNLVNDKELQWKPATGSNWMTSGQLLKHITDACGAPVKGFVTGDWGMPEGVNAGEIPPEDMLPSAEKLPTIKSVAEAKKLLEEDQKLAVHMLDITSEEDLEKKPATAPWDPTVMILGHRILQMIDHLKQHKGQLFYYLKLQGKPVHTGNLWGM